MTSLDMVQIKQKAAIEAVNYIQSGMIVGLGFGSTALLAVRQLGELLGKGKLTDVLGIPSSIETETLALQLGIPLTTLEEHPVIDLTIDGADEIDPDLQLIKGGGGALLREKIVAQASRQVIIIADDSKRSLVLGTHWPVPIEVIPFGWGSQYQFLRSIGGDPQVRMKQDGSRFITDQGNTILDCRFGPIKDLRLLATQLDQRVGIVAHGIFLDMATTVIYCGRTGCEHILRSNLKDH
ncbi:MAG: ribose-5-phosphate isomerase RpiA [Chloroflexota bacterium]